MQNTKRLRVAGHARQLAVRVYGFTSDFPLSERFGITSQMRRAAVSIGSNIAEDCGRRTNKQLLNFLYIAAGSASELEFQVELARDLGFGDAQTGRAVLEEIESLRRMLSRLISFLRTQPAWRPGAEASTSRVDD